MRKKNVQREAALTYQHHFVVRFSEVDMMGVAWHGSYVTYMEDGREQFGIHYAGLGYDDYFRTRYVAPVVNLNIDYKQSLKCGDHAIVEIRYIKSPAAKVIFDYTIYREKDMAVMATATTTQVFLDPDGNLQYTCPDFYEEWKKRWLSE